MLKRLYGQVRKRDTNGKVLKLTDTVEKYQEARRLSQDLRTFADQKTNIPVYAERKKHVEEKLRVLKEQEEKKNAEWVRLTAEYIRFSDQLAGIPSGKKNIFLNWKERELIWRKRCHLCR